MSGSLISVIGGVITIIGAAITLIGGYVSSQQKASTDRALLSGNTALQGKVDSTKDALIAKGNELTEVQKMLEAAQVALVAKTDENAALSKRFAEYAMGTGSFIYLHVLNFGSSAQKTRIKHVGENPVRATAIVAYDISDQVHELATGRRARSDLDNAPHREATLENSFGGAPTNLSLQLFETTPTRDAYCYLVLYNGANGTYRQTIQLVKVGETWRQAYRLERHKEGTTWVPVGEYFEPEFPTNGDILVRASASFPILQ